MLASYTAVNLCMQQPLTPRCALYNLNLVASLEAAGRVLQKMHGRLDQLR